jgi:uncharacterized membrane protein
MTATGAERLERIVGLVLRVGVTISSVSLTAGLAASFWNEGSPIARLLLNAGVVVLLATPIARVVVSIGEYASERDWTFVTLTTIVLVELMVSVIAALVFNRRL